MVAALGVLEPGTVLRVWVTLFIAGKFTDGAPRLRSPKMPNTFGTDA